VGLKPDYGQLQKSSALFLKFIIWTDEMHLIRFMKNFDHELTSNDEKVGK
jgi:hypothetical protein